MRFLGYGDGSDGTRLVTSTATDTVDRTNLAATASSGQKTANFTGSFSTGDFVFIHETRHATNHGKFELNRINNYSAGNVTLEYNLTNTYYSAQVIRVPQYRSFTINSGITLSVPAWSAGANDGGISVIMSQNVVKVAGTWNGRSKGFSAPGTETARTPGVCLQGKSYADDSQDYSGSANQGGGGGGTREAQRGGGGGGGGHATAGQDGIGDGSCLPGTGGDSYGNSAFSLIYLGSGGGQGGGDKDSPGSFNGGAGGYGGAIIIVIAPYLWVPSGGYLDVRGGDGAVGSGDSGNGGGGGGAGSGGSFWGHGLVDCDITGTISIAGGVGGDSPYGGDYDGGNGSIGRARLETCQKTGSVTGGSTDGPGVWCGDAGTLSNIGG